MCHCWICLQEDKPFQERVKRIPPGCFEGSSWATGRTEKNWHYLRVRKPLYLSQSGSVKDEWFPEVLLNAKQENCQWSILPPWIEDALQCLSGEKWFNVLDLKRGYYQIPMHPEDKTTFICPLGFLLKSEDFDSHSSTFTFFCCNH